MANLDTLNAERLTLLEEIRALFRKPKQTKKEMKTLKLKLDQYELKQAAIHSEINKKA